MVPDISVVIPVFNEEESLKNLIAHLNSFFSTKKYTTEIIFIDDGSTDKSYTLLKKVNCRYFSAKLIKFSRNFGSHAALRAGVFYATGKATTFLFCDLQDPIELIDLLWNKLNKGNNIVLGRRENLLTSVYDRFFTKFFAYLIKKWVNPQFPDNGLDIVMFDRKVRYEINQHIEPNSSLFLQILNLGFKIDSISYKKKARLKGKSKWTWSKKIKYVIDSLASFSYAPIRLISLIGVIMSLAGLTWALYVFARFLILNDLERGWPSLIAILMIGFGMTNISLGIIAEYLWRTLDITRGRKVFIVEQIIKLQNTFNE